MAMRNAKTVERIDALLAKLPTKPRIKLAAKYILCLRRGPLGTNAVELRDRLREIEKGLPPTV